MVFVFVDIICTPPVDVVNKTENIYFNSNDPESLVNKGKLVVQPANTIKLPKCVISKVWQLPQQGAA